MGSAGSTGARRKTSTLWNPPRPSPPPDTARSIARSAFRSSTNFFTRSFSTVRLSMNAPAPPSVLPAAVATHPYSGLLSNRMPLTSASATEMASRHRILHSAHAAMKPAVLYAPRSFSWLSVFVMVSRSTGSASKSMPAVLSSTARPPKRSAMALTAMVNAATAVAVFASLSVPSSSSSSALPDSPSFVSFLGGVLAFLIEFAARSTLRAVVGLACHASNRSCCPAFSTGLMTVAVVADDVVASSAPRVCSWLLLVASSLNAVFASVACLGTVLSLSSPFASVCEVAWGGDAGSSTARRATEDPRNEWKLRLLLYR
mmetsp:Transcript_5322/g.12188  ORF Transcript_5322/g.12188 Transcript_5322/m.12188 type:complete len:316 (+) Transcript_5322:1319-2266(+)